MAPSLYYYNPASLRRTRRITLIVATICIIVCMALTHLLLPRPATRPVSAPPPASTAYIARVHNNLIAIYAEGVSSPVFVTDIDVRALPSADRELLATGIQLSSEEALTKLLEDYGS